MLNNELIDFLKKFDTPTISNALDIEDLDLQMVIQNIPSFQPIIN